MKKKINKKNKTGVKKRQHLLDAFGLYPKVDFFLKENDEKVILILRQHPITQLPWVLNAIVFFLFIIVFNILLKDLLFKIFSFYEILSINLLFLALVFSYIVINFTVWFFNVGIITDRRIFDLDFYPLTVKDFTVTELETVQDVSSSYVGVFSNIFKYGDVRLQTAGTKQNVEFLRVPYPNKVAKIISKLLLSVDNRQINES